MSTARRRAASGPALDDLPRVKVDTREDLRAWLTSNHTRTTSVWLVTPRPRGDRPGLPYGDIVDEALCFGWIDSRPRALDDASTMLLLSPRRPGSAWSKINRDKVARLLAAGRIAAPGLAAIERAKADGSWDRLAAVDDLEPPPDLVAAFAAHPGSAARFAGFPRSARRAILEWIVQARRPETRAARVAETAARAAAGERANHRPRR